MAAMATLAGGAAASAQGRGAAGNWPTASADPQRTSWVRADAKISKESLAKPGFQLLWKAKLDNQARHLQSLTQPLLLQNIISYKGFKALAFVGGSADNVYSLDYDLNKVFWKTHLSSGVTTAGTAACPAALTTITRAATLAVPAGGRGGRGAAPPAAGAAPAAPAAPVPPGASPAAAAPGGARGGSPGTLPAGTGAPTPAPTEAGRGQAPAAPPAGRGGGGGGFGGGNNNVLAISSGGMVHVLNVQTGADINPPIKFLPSGAKPIGSALIGTTFYTATTDNCGGAANGVYALDLSTEARTVSSWDAKGAAIAGTVAPTFGGDGAVYVATGAGSSTYANAVVALESAGLTVKDWFSPGSSPFVSAPVAFQFQGKEMVAAANQDGRIYLLDSSALGGADHKTPLARSAQYATAGGAFMPGALATWQDADGTRWIAVPTGAAPAADAKFAAGNGAVTGGAILTFKVTGTATPAIEPGWVSRDLTGPVTPLIMNGVVFAVAGGSAPGAQLTAAQRAQRAKPAVLYALDATSGKELWNSGTSITAPVFNVGPAGGDSQIYVVTHDGTLYAFGMPTER